MSKRFQSTTGQLRSLRKHLPDDTVGDPGDPACLLHRNARQEHFVQHLVPLPGVESLKLCHIVTAGKMPHDRGRDLITQARELFLYIQTIVVIFLAVKA